MTQSTLTSSGQVPQLYRPARRPQLAYPSRVKIKVLVYYYGMECCLSDLHSYVQLSGTKTGVLRVLGALARPAHGQPYCAHIYTLA